MSHRHGLSRVAPGPLAAFGVALLAAGCGGGGSSGGVDSPSSRLIVGSPATVLELAAPLGTSGARGAGSAVFLSATIKDREFNPVDIEVEFGYDVDGDGKISGSDGAPTETDEYFPATPVAGVGDGMFGLATAGGKGASHLFVWDSSRDLPGGRFVTQDYRYDDRGRHILGSDGTPTFSNYPGLKLRMRANDALGGMDRENRWGAWTESKPFDFNNNSQPAVVIDSAGLSGVTPNATGTAADEDVVLNFRVIDADSITAALQDPVAVAVDYAAIPTYSPEDRNGNSLLDDPFDIALDAPYLQWFPATPKAETPDTGLVSAPGVGVAATFTWDSIADVGTVSAPFLLRVSPYDGKKEHGPTVAMAAPFRLDNYTVFTDVGAALGSARIAHRATILADDRVLVTGGRTTSTGSSVATAEIFFPGFGQTTFGAVAPTAPMGTARSHHAQVRLHDGRVLVAGGFGPSGSPLNSLEIYDPSTGQWTAVASTLSAARAQQTAVLLADGDVLLAGGVDASGNALASADVFRIATESVVAASGGMVAARHSVEGALLPDGRALIPGGKDTAGSALSSVEIFDPETNTFSAGPALAAARAEHTVSNAVDGTVVVAGGVGVNSVAIFDPAAGAWDNSAPTLSSSRAGHAGVLLGDGKLLVAGGLEGAAVGGTAAVFDPAAGSWDPANGTMRSARRDAASVVLNNGRVLILGGADAAGAALASIEVFTPDGGFNRLPTALAVTPSIPFSWAFGAVLTYRLVDPEGDPARALFQYSVSGGPWLACTERYATIAGDTSDGTLSVASATKPSTLPVDPVLKNTPGDHFFIWDTEADIAKADYDSIRVRVIPMGANLGVASATQPWKVLKNTFVIARIDPFVSPVGGTIDLAYHLQDLDGNAARVRVEYARDLNGDRQILEESGEAWKVCAMAPGGEGLGAGYTLSTSATYDPDTSTPGWHHFLWDSVRDLGSPDFGETWTDYFVRIIPYDFPAGDAVETQGRTAVMTSDQGLRIVLDPNGLYLLSWGTEGGTTYAGTPIANVKLDETLIFRFNREVDPGSVDGTVGLSTLKVAVAGRQILGAYQADPSDYKVVRFFPQVNDVVDFAPKYAGTEDPTVLVRGMSVAVSIPGYQAGTSPEAGPFLRIRGWTAGEAAVDIVNLLTRSYSPACTTSTAAGTGAYFARGVAPVAVGATPGLGDANQSLTQGFAIEFDRPISPDSVVIQNLRFVVDLNGNGVADANDSIIPGSVSLQNTAGPAGVQKSILVFTPLAGTTLPSGAQILASFVGVTAGDGTVAQGYGGGTPVTYFSTVAGSTTTVSFTESFNNTTNRDGSATTALWNDSSYPGMLTGLRVGGSGADGTPTPNSTSGSVKTFSSKAVWNFTSLTIPKGEMWRFTGGPSNQPVEIYSIGNVEIAGVLDVSGGDGETHYDECLSQITIQPPYGKRYTSVQTSGGIAMAGGSAAAGGGAGAYSRHLQAGLAGTAGAGGSGSTAGAGGQQYSSTYQCGGGGGGHADAGQPGGLYNAGYGTPASGGGTYGTSSFSSGMTAGSGGGSGSSFYTYYAISDPITWGSSTYSTFYFYNPGGGGGGGGGAVKIACNGAFTVRGSGLIDASGGNGGDGLYYYAGGGGGGSGGSVWIVSGETLTLGGIVDVRGGVGGEILGYHPYAYGTRYGSYGGHGGHGRIRIEAPNVGTVRTNFLAGTAFNTVSSGSLDAGTGSLGTFPGSTSQTINIDSIQKDANGIMNFSTMNIPAGVTITLTGSTAAKMRFTGNVNISGVLAANGGTGTGNAGGTSGTAPNVPAGTAGPGGYIGGVPNPANTTTHTVGGSGGGPGGGTGGNKANGYVSGAYVYFYGTGPGAGGSNLLNFRGTPVGTGPGAIPNTYNNFSMDGNICFYYGAGYGATRVPALAKPGYTEPDAITISNIVGGSGGGAGANSGYNYNSGSTLYFYSASSGGGGGGAIAIETDSNFSMGASGRIDVVGGNGGQYPYSYYVGAGGGGAGGTVLIRASTYTLGTGSTINAYGGIGGHGYSAPTSYNMNTGGVGGPGAARIEAVTLPSVLNLGGLLGYSASTGSLTTGTAAGGGDTGTTLWRTAAGLAPDFHGQALNRSGSVDVFLEGAMSDPVTGLRSTTLTGQQNIAATPLTTGFGSPDAIDGFKYWRVVFKLKPPQPEVYDVTVQTTTK